ncbi:hypothetical protein C8D92_1193 [Tamilnaduibacter salinus]|uniref:Uncharacterized protein n=1 Tax=Tamilnaduibacter salinus TaxID=1484056 RepID=A0A2U1CSY2_9GAMM|nr:hypothetical protein [Tamilnaduibacter salinus]PVY69218.1 hypothetical protein C8D92_1193 [Tamilnaduibacter salinus]
MHAEISEGLFAAYLDDFNIRFERHYPVSGNSNVDFRVETSSVVLCDVKEVRDSRSKTGNEIDAFSHIREDLRDLRKKFKKTKPSDPVVLVTMNFSSNFFTALTVARAMLGDVGVEFFNGTRSEMNHLPRGNAALTKQGNTSISGVVVFDPECGNHRYFTNPFASNPLQEGFFPGIDEIKLSRDAGEEQLVGLSKIMWWQYAGAK